MTKTPSPYTLQAIRIRDHIERIAYWVSINRDWRYQPYELEYDCDLSSWVESFFPGWKYAGMGSYRVALVSPEGHVVKLDLDNAGGNEQEVCTYEFIVSHYPESQTAPIRPVPTWGEVVEKDFVVYQEYIEVLPDSWINYDEGIPWLYEISDGLQGGVCAVTGIGYVWDLQF
jgi:hypothetical protein